MALIVQKFGGSSVKDRDRIFNVARIVANTHNAGNDVVVVVSAQGDTTDDLIAKAAEITHNPSAREMDMLLAAGEEISISLLAMALNELGCHATSLTGWQAGFRTDRAYTKARITKLETERISSELERNRVVVVAGFQGLNKLDDITTLGRGGSDTSAVAIAAALHADRCQIFTDVEGVYTADPRKVRNTRKLDEITFDEMLELASLGAQVLNNRSVELAKKYNVELEVLSSLNPVPGTVVKEVVKDVEGMLIKGVAKDTDVAVITILNVPDEPGTSRTSMWTSSCSPPAAMARRTSASPVLRARRRLRCASCARAHTSIRSPATRPAPRCPSWVPVCRATAAWPPRCSRPCPTTTSTSR